MQRVRKYKEEQDREFPDDPGVRTQYFHCRGPGSIPCQGTKIMPATWHSQEKKKKKKMKTKMMMTEIRDTITETKNTLEGICSRLNDTGELINNLEDKATAITQS